MLMGADDGGIEHHVLIVRIFHQGPKDTIENTAFAPPPETLVDILPTTEPLRKVTPRDARAITVKDSLNKKPVVHRRATNMAITTGKKILDPIPLIVPQSITTHRSAPNQADLL